MEYCWKMVSKCVPVFWLKLWQLWVQVLESSLSDELSNLSFLSLLCVSTFKLCFKFVYFEKCVSFSHFCGFIWSSTLISICLHCFSHGWPIVFVFDDYNYYSNVYWPLLVRFQCCEVQIPRIVTFDECCSLILSTGSPRYRSCWLAVKVYTKYCIEAK